MNLCPSARRFLTDLVQGIGQQPQVSDPVLVGLIEQAVGLVEDLYYTCESTNLLFQDLYEQWDGYLQSVAKIGLCVTGTTGSEWLRTACDTWSTSPRGGGKPERDLVAQVHNLAGTELTIAGGVKVTGASNAAEPVYVKWTDAQPVTDSGLTKAVNDLTSGLATDFQGLDTAVTTGATEVSTSIGGVATAVTGVATAIGTAAGVIGGAISGLATAILGAGVIAAGGNLLSSLLGGAYHMSGIHNLLHGFNPSTGGSLLSGAVHGIGHLFHHSSGSDTDAELNYNLQHRLDPLVGAYDGIASFRQTVSSWTATESVSVKTNSTDTVSVSGTVKLDSTEAVNVSGTVKLDTTESIGVTGTVTVQNSAQSPLHVTGSMGFDGDVKITSPLNGYSQVIVSDAGVQSALETVISRLEQLITILGCTPGVSGPQTAGLMVRFDPDYYTSDQAALSSDGHTLKNRLSGTRKVFDGYQDMGTWTTLVAPTDKVFNAYNMSVIKANSNCSLATY